MTATTLAVGTEVTVSLGGEWEHLRGVPLRIASIVRASTYAGGFAVRLAGITGYLVPRKPVAAAYVVPVPAKSGPRQIAPNITVPSPLSVADLERAVVSLTARCDELERTLERLVGTVGRAITAVRALGHSDATVELVPETRVTAELPDPAQQVPGAGQPLHALDEILESVFTRHGCTLEDLRSRSKVHYVVRARDELLFELRRRNPKRWSYPELGRLLCRDPTSAMASIEREGLRRAKDAA